MRIDRHQHVHRVFHHAIRITRHTGCSSKEIKNQSQRDQYTVKTPYA